MKQKPIVVVGSINTDLVVTSAKIPSSGETVLGSDFQIHPGGKGANQAVAIARLGYPVQLIGRLGRDTFGTGLRSLLQAAGVDCSLVATCEGSSGVAVILVSEQGENCIVVAPGANAKVTPEDLDANSDAIRTAGMVLTQLEIPLATVEHLAHLCRREGVPLMLDPAPARPLPREVIRSSVWFTPNESEAEFYAAGTGRKAGRSSAPEIACSILAQGAGGVILKMGSRGAYLSTGPQEAYSVPAFPVSAVDTTAAGDAFNGAFATALMLGKSPLESARFAAAVAGISVTRPGAQTSLPTMPEVQEFLENHLLEANA